MLRVWALLVALTVMVAAGAAQVINKKNPLSGSAALIGLSVFTSDGREIGKVVDVVREPEPQLVAEVERWGGIGPHVVLIPIDMFVQRVDRIELTITFEQVADRLEGPEHEP
jgi:sporulation protein YlmC with PRC-barrel domain